VRRTTPSSRPKPASRGTQPARAVRAASRERRRDERAEVRRFTRRSRQRRLAVTATVGSFALLVAGVAVVTLSPIMALETVTVVGTNRLDATTVGAALDEHIGTPLALLDDATIRDDLEAFPLIRSFSTEVIPPHTLVVRIVERAPIGAIERGAVVDLVDAAGVVVESSAERPVGIPLIASGSTDADSIAFQSVAEVLTALPAELRAQVDVISASTRDDVTFTMTGLGHVVVWGSAESSALKARVLAAAIAATGQGAASEFDVSAPESLVVRQL
jgi:cell division protein FtsQ